MPRRSPLSFAPSLRSNSADLISRLSNGEINRPQAKQLFDRLWPENVTVSLTGVQMSASAGRVTAIIEELGLKQMSDGAALEAIVDQVLVANPKSIDEYRAGKDKAFNALVGQVMKASQGKANPGQVNELLKKKLAR